MTIEAELPDGRVLEFPDGTDRAVIQSAVKKMLGAPAAQATSGPDPDLAKIDSMMAQREQPRPQQQGQGFIGDSDLGVLGRGAMRALMPGPALMADALNSGVTTADLNYMGQQFKKGVAATAGLPVDAVTNLANLGIAGYGRVKGAFGSTDLPELIRDPVGGSGSFERLFQVNNQIEPSSRATQVGGRFVRDLGMAALPAGALASKAANPLASLGIQGILSTAASAGGETARAVAPEGYEDVADASGSLLTGVALPGVIANRLSTIKDPNRFEKAKGFANEYVKGRLEDDVRNYPGAAQNLDDAMRLEGEIPGLKYRVGQGSGVPSLVDVERKVATSGPEQFNRRVQQEAAQQAAIRAEAQRRLPLLAGKNDVADQLTTTQEQRRALAGNLPETDAAEVGQALRQGRQSFKGRYDQIVSEKFQAPVIAAEKLGVKVNVDQIIEKTSEILKSPILQFDATNAPAIARRMQSVLNKELPDQSPIVGPGGQPIRQFRDRSWGVPFAELKAMREAVNQDIAREVGSPTPNARQRLRALVDIKNEIDRAAQTTPDEVRKPYNEAVKYFRDVYAPRFLRGVNLKQSLRDVTGEMRIPDEKLAAQYFKPLGTTPMNRFLDLYGDSPQAMKVMESHILDTYRRYTIKDGVIDPLKHEAFMKNYGPALKKLPDIAENFKSIAKASHILAEREGVLAHANKILSQGQLDALKYESLPDAGLDPRKLNAFITKNGDAFAESVGAIYGKKVADDHLKHLRDIAKAAEIADRGSLSAAAAPAQGISPMSMQANVGFTGRTVFSMMRAVTTGRTSPHDVAYTLGAQSVSHRINKLIIAAEERAISDPETASLIAQAVKTPADSAKAKQLFARITKAGSAWLVGGDQWADMAKYRTAPFAAQATQEGLVPGEDQQQERNIRYGIDGTMVPNRNVRRSTPYDGGTRG